MVAGKSPERLPPGWSEHVKVKNGRKVKYYTNVRNGKTCYSKKDVISYMKMKGNCHGRNRGIAKRETGHSKRNTNSKILKTVEDPDKSLEWLPPGWTFEEKTRMSGVTNGQTYKCYIDPSGRRFYSKPEVLRNLKTVKRKGPIAEEKKHTIEESSRKKAPQNVKEATDDRSHTSRKQKSGTGKQPLDTVSPHNIEESSHKKVSQNVKEATDDQSHTSRKQVKEATDDQSHTSRKQVKEVTDDQCHTSRKQKSGTGKQPSDTVSPHNIEEHSRKKASQNVKEATDDQSHTSRKQVKEATDDQSHTSRKQKSGTGKQPSDTVFPHNIEESSRKKASQNVKEPSDDQSHTSRKQVEATDDQSHTSRKKKSGTGKQPSDTVSPIAVQSNLVDELPPGWIEEIKTRAYARGKRKYLHYVDPVSGYVFVSKKDALSYIETGDIGKCVTKPKKRDPGSATIVESASISATDEKVGQSSTKRQYLAGEESKTGSDPTDIATPQAESIKKRLRSAVHDVVNTQGAELKTEKHLRKTENEGSGRKLCSEARPSDLNGETRVTASSSHRKLPGSEESKTGSDPTDIATPQAESIKKRLRSAVHDVVNTQGAELRTEKHSRKTENEGSGRKLRSEARPSDLNGETRVTASSSQRKLPGSEKQKHNSTASITKLRKARTNKDLGSPSWFSKRLAGHSPAEVANLGLSERALRAAIRNSGRAKVKTSSARAPSNPAQEIHAVSNSVGTEANTSTVQAPSNPAEEIHAVSISYKTEANTSLVHGPSNPAEETHAVSSSFGTEANTSTVQAPSNPDEETHLCNFVGTEANTSSVQAPGNPALETCIVRNSLGTEANISSIQAPSGPDEETHAVSNSFGTEANISSVQAPSNPDEETHAVSDSVGTEANTSSVQGPSNPAEETNAVSDSVGTEANTSSVQPPSNPAEETCAVRNSLETKASTSSVQAPSGPAQETHAVSNSVRTEANTSSVQALSNPAQVTLAVRNSLGTEASTSSVQAPSDPAQEMHDVRDSVITEADASPVQAPSNQVQEAHWIRISDESVPDPSIPDREMPQDINEPPMNEIEQTCIAGESSSRTENCSVSKQPITERPDAEYPRLEDSQMRYPFVDCWSDPCLEFAYKTLTGVIPVEDCLAYDCGPNQQFDPPYMTQSDGCFDLPIFDSYSLFPNDFPSHSGPLDKQNAPQDLPPAPSAFLSPGNTGLPSCSGIASQPHLETRKDFPAKAKS